LKLNRISNKNAGMGRITMPIIANRTIGAPKPDDTDLNWFLSNRPKYEANCINEILTLC
jgi:hypothetical protein